MTDIKLYFQLQETVQYGKALGLKKLFRRKRSSAQELPAKPSDIIWSTKTVSKEGQEMKENKKASLKNSNSVNVKQGGSREKKKPKLRL